MIRSPRFARLRRAVSVLGFIQPQKPTLVEEPPVDQFARPVALVAADRFSRLEGAQAVEAQALEYAADGGGRDAGIGGDRLAGQALAAQRLDAIDRGWGCWLPQMIGT